MPESVSVRKVETKKDFKVFFEFPWTVYKGDPNWVPPLLSQRKHLLDRKKNPSWDYMVGDYFVAWRGDKPVGTIAAFINKRHNETWEENIGWFGLFECFNDQEAATALLQTAAAYVKALGAQALRGPANFTLNDECGLLIENFSQPVILMPYNHPYYQQLIENSGVGLSKIMDVISLWGTPQGYMGEDGKFNEKLVRVVEKTKERKKITTRGADPKILVEELKLLRAVYESAWEKNWGFVRPTDREMDALFASLKDFFDARLGRFAFVDGKIAGFMMGLPDMNEVLRHAYPRPGVPEIFTLLAAFWHWKIRPKFTRQRVLLFGVNPEYRRSGVDAAIFYDYITNTLKSYPYVDLGWVLETNTGILTVAKTFGCDIYKRYRFFQATL